jgi:uroporphyrinogen III methyltransferase/synthase
MDEEGARMLRDSISADMLDVLTFTSGSTVRYFAEAVGQPGRAIVAVIGPVTAQVAQEHDMTVSIQAEPHTISGLVESIMDHFRRLGRPTEE